VVCITPRAGSYRDRKVFCVLNRKFYRVFFCLHDSSELVASAMAASGKWSHNTLSAWYQPRYQPAASVLPNAFIALVVTAISVSGNCGECWLVPCVFFCLDDSSELVASAMAASSKWSAWSKVKQLWVCLVLRWWTTREPYVLNQVFLHSQSFFT
jgi:hypothetical protein